MEACPASSPDENEPSTLGFLASSPPPSSMTSSKPRKPPPVTPRRFTKFFTPRTRSSAAALSKSGRHLRDITRNGSNLGYRSSKLSTLGKRALFDDKEKENTGPCIETPRSRKRKRGLPTPDSSPFMSSSPIKRCGSPIQVHEDVAEEDVGRDVEQGVRQHSPTLHTIPEPIWPSPIARKAHGGSTARLISREFGGASALGRGRRRDHCADWRSQTTNFYTGAEHRYRFQNPCLPFCVASGHANDLVAIGEESGGVAILNTSLKATDGHCETLSIKSHSNAVMDVAFSSDDSIIATASGDQHCHILDVQTLAPRLVLRGHISSVKQIRFQPGNNNMIATSSRDGSIQLWDLRCKGTDFVLDLPDPANPDGWISSKAPHLPAYNTVLSGHLEREAAMEHPSRRAGISVTALSFLGEGRNHLLLSGSEASTSVRLWDIRSRYSRRGPATPVSSTALPEAHSAHRHYGINSIVVSTDQSRFYALSRDNTVYAYSTNHLVLGSAPELSTSLKRQPRSSGNGAKGLGPLYGFRHRSFHATSFYVKAAIRKATDHQPELLAVGSSDGTPVLFPTDELFMEKEVTTHDDDDRSDDAQRCDSPIALPRPSLSRTTNSGPPMGRPTIPIYQAATPLVRGHAREVTSLTWTRKGELVTLGDDYTCRLWKEGSEARDLRLAGETEGKRWGCGWAETSETEDEDE